MNTFIKALLIINPRSGKMKSRKGLYDVVNSLNNHGYEVTVFCTKAPKEATEITAAKAHLYELIICCGGDGTLNEVISGLIQAKVKLPIGYIPTGTTNDFARTLNLPNGILEAIEVAIHGTPMDYDIGKLGEDVFFSYIASFGAFSAVSYVTPQWLKNRVGHLAYMLQGIIGFRGIQSYKVKVKMDGMDIEDEFIFGSVTNTTSIGGIVTLPSGEVALSDGLFEVLLIRRPQSREDLRNIFRGLKIQKYDGYNILLTHTNHIAIAFDTGVEWATDGEFGGRYNKVDIQVAQGRMQIMQSNAKTATTTGDGGRI